MPSQSSAATSPLTLQQLLDRGGHDLPFSPLLASYSCPVERGPVKEDFDADRYKLGSTLVANVAQMRLRPKLSSNLEPVIRWPAECPECRRGPQPVGLKSADLPAARVGPVARAGLMEGPAGGHDASDRSQYGTGCE
jgi:hypothetical protein